MFLLAGHLGRTVAELEESLGSSELNEWKAYFSIEPFGAGRDNFHAAQITAAVINSQQGRKVAVKPRDFLFEHPEIKRRRETDHVLTAFKALAKKKDG